MSFTIKIILGLLVAAGVSAGGYTIYRQQAQIDVIVQQPVAPTPQVVDAPVVPSSGQKIPAGDIRTDPKVRY
jgi:hypothetical protein